MSSFLDELETELEDVVRRRASARIAFVADRGPRASLADRGSRGGRARLSARVVVAVTALLMVLAAAALAATGVLFTGTAVPPTPGLSKDAGLGLPEPGHVRLIARSVPDPAGGLPWSMRIVRTTSGLVCLQVGRLHDGRIGVLGQDGAFHDDGLFHTLRMGTLEAMPHGYATACEPQGETFTEEVIGMPQSGQLPREGTIGRPSQERRLYYGLLGPNAVSIAYREGASTRTLPVEPGTGAYLIVMPAGARSPKAVTTGGSKALQRRDGGRLRADAPMLSILYRVHGRLCVEAGVRPAAFKACPRESESQLEHRLHVLERPDDLHVPIHVTLHAMKSGWWRSVPTKDGHPTRPPGAIDGVYYEASIELKAPFAVENADSGYSVWLRSSRSPVVTYGGLGGGAGYDLERDVRRGAPLRTQQEDVFANFPDGAVTISVYYYNLLGHGHRSTLVGSTTIRRP
jgi:hypothetical protein